MKYLLLFPLSLLGLTLLPDPSPGGWGSGGFAAPALVSAPSYQAPTYRWVFGPGEQYHLMYGGHQVGTFRLDDEQYYPFDGQGWGESCPCPCKLPVGKKAKAKKKAADCDCHKSCPCGDPCLCNGAKRCSPDCDCGQPKVETVQGRDGKEYLTGVDRSKMHDRERYTINGREVVCAEAHTAVNGKEGTLADDSHKPWLAFVGAESECKDAIAKLPSTIMDHYLVQEYRPDETMTKDRNGSRAFLLPGLTVVARDGKQLHHQVALADLPGLTTALRKVDPNFDPSKTPDRSKPDPSPMVPSQTGFLGVSWVVWAIGGGLLLLLRRKQ